MKAQKQIIEPQIIDVRLKDLTKVPLIFVRRLDFIQSKSKKNALYNRDHKKVLREWTILQPLSTEDPHKYNLQHSSDESNRLLHPNF